MELEITPEPTDAERVAIAEALARTDGARELPDPLTDADDE